MTGCLRFLFVAGTSERVLRQLAHTDLPEVRVSLPPSRRQAECLFQNMNIADRCTDKFSGLVVSVCRRRAESRLFEDHSLANPR